MTDRDRDRLPAGRPPWDAWNGARVGSLTGALFGVLVVFVFGGHAYWLALVTTLVGGFIGYWTERRKRRDFTS